MRTFPICNHTRSFEPNVNYIDLIERYRQNYINVRLLNETMYNSEIGRAIRTDLTFARMQINTWLLSKNISQNNEAYIILRRHIPHDVVRKIWVEFLVSPFTDRED